MRTKVALLIFVSSLWTGALAGAATPPASSASMSQVPFGVTPPVNPFEASPCLGNSSAEGAMFASGTASDPWYCGACSQSNCVGEYRGNMCYMAAYERWGFCHINNVTDICPADGQWRCFCQDNDMS